LPIIGLLSAAGLPIGARTLSGAPASRTQACPDDDSGIALPPGFCAIVFADYIGHARYLVGGVPNPKDYGSPMPPKGGAQLSGSDVSAVAAYIWAHGHQAAR
jgi:hypothetical protein